MKSKQIKKIGDTGFDKVLFDQFTQNTLLIFVEILTLQEFQQMSGFDFDRVATILTPHCPEAASVDASGALDHPDQQRSPGRAKTLRHKSRVRAIDVSPRVLLDHAL